MKTILGFLYGVILTCCWFGTALLKPLPNESIHFLAIPAVLLSIGAVAYVIGKALAED